MIHRVAYKYWVAIILVMALFMEFLDGTIVNVAMPTFARVFEAGATAIGWVSTAYLLAIAVVVLVSGWAGERFGTKRVFLVATGVFTLGSALCASATSLRALVAFRALQGMGGGMMTPVGVSMLMRAFPVEERARASGALMVPTMLAPVMAPFLGGYLVQYHGWPWIFWINVPLGAVTWVAAAWLLRESREASPGRLDLEGLAVSTVALGCIFYTLSRLGEGADRPAGVAGAAAVGVVALVTFLVRQWRKTHPLMDLRVFGDRLFATGAGLQFLLIGGLSGSLFALTLCLQEGQGRSPLLTGALSVAQAVGTMILMPIAGARAARWGQQRTVMTGIAVYTATTALWLATPTLTHLGLLVPVLVLRGTGLGCCLSLSWSGAFAHIPLARMGRATAVMSVMIQLGGALGVACAALALSLAPGGASADLLPYRAVLGGFALLGLGCLVLSFWHGPPRRAHADCSASPAAPGPRARAARARRVPAAAHPAP